MKKRPGDGTQGPDTNQINPAPEKRWLYTRPVVTFAEIFNDRAYPVTPEGITGAVKELG